MNDTPTKGVNLTKKVANYVFCPSATILVLMLAAIIIGLFSDLIIGTRWTLYIIVPGHQLLAGKLFGIMMLSLLLLFVSSKIRDN